MMQFFVMFSNVAGRLAYASTRINASSGAPAFPFLAILLVLMVFSLTHGRLTLYCLWIHRPALQICSRFVEWSSSWTVLFPTWQLHHLTFRVWQRRQVNSSGVQNISLLWTGSNSWSQLLKRWRSLTAPSPWPFRWMPHRGVEEQFFFKPMVQWSLKANCCLKQRVFTAISRGKC